jgi:hypothetical protein
MKGNLQLAGIPYKNQSILDYQPRREESLPMQSYGQYEHQNSSVFHGTNGGQDLLHLPDDDSDTELKKNCSLMELVLKSLVQSGFFAIFGKTVTVTGLP